MDSRWCRAPYCTTELATNDADLCNLCWEHRRFLRDEIPPLWYGARQLLPPGSATTGLGRLSGPGPGSCPPLRLSVYTALEWVVATLAIWATWIRQEAGKSVPDDLSQTRWEWCLAWSVETLERLDHLVGSTTMRLGYYLALADAYRSLIVTGGLARDVRVPTPCPDCQRMTVISVQGNLFLTCLTCGHRWSHAAYLATLTPDGPTASMNRSTFPINSAYRSSSPVPRIPRQRNGDGSL